MGKQSNIAFAVIDYTPNKKTVLSWIPDLISPKGVVKRLELCYSRVLGGRRDLIGGLGGGGGGSGGRRRIAAEAGGQDV